MKVWLHTFVVAIGGGACTSAADYLSRAGTAASLRQIGVSAATGALLTAAAFLLKSPLHKEDPK